MLAELDQNGFLIKENIYSEEEVIKLIDLINQEELEYQFGIREFLINRPHITEKVFNPNLIQLIKQISPNCQKAIKSIYFNKPPNANWIVNWHQDLTINLINKDEIKGYKNWRETKDRVVVQPPIQILENIFTIRIHLDDCTIQNGALRVIKGSHKNGIIDMKEGKENNEIDICEVDKGGVLIMRPLILHSSKRTENNQNRRVIHIEFTSSKLPENLKWKEKVSWN